MKNKPVIKKKYKEKKTRGALFVVFLMAGLGLYLLFFDYNKKLNFDSEQSLSSEVRSRILPAAIDQSIDGHLKSSQDQEDRGRTGVYIDSTISAPPIETGRLDPSVFINEKAPHPLIIDQQGHSNKVAEAIKKFDQKKQSSMSPADQIDRRLARDEWLSDYDKKYEKEYIRAFLDNAREQGYEVYLNDDLEIIGIHEIKKDEPLRFPDSIRGKGSTTGR